MIPGCGMLKINFVYISRDLKYVIGDAVMKSLVAIEPNKITSNCCKNLETMVINFWNM
jgi:hypothetical protein